MLAGWLCGLSWVLYLDRICMAQAIPPIQRELGLSNTQVGYTLMAFTLAYGLFEMPSGWLGDRFGSRRVLVRIVIWWSIFTALTGSVTGLATLLLVRFLFGVGEAGAFPNVARVLGQWYPSTERGRVQGFILAAAQLGGVAAPTVAAYLIEGLGWRWAFVAFGSIGLVWAAGFWFWFRDDPAEHPRVNRSEVAIIRQGEAASPVSIPGAIPWRTVCINSGFWTLGAIILCSSFNSYFCNSWFPKYLVSSRGLGNTESGWLTSLVLLGSAMGVLVGGVVADRISRSPRRVTGRSWLGRIAYCCGAIALFFATRCDQAWSIAALAGLSCLCVQMTLPTWWSAAIEQSGRHVGSLFGLLNMIGIFGALASQWFVGVFADWQASRGLSGREQWDPLFDVYIGALVFGMIGWSVYQIQPLPEGDKDSHRQR